jgi:hypothetical protein
MDLSFDLLGNAIVSAIDKDQGAEGQLPACGADG